MRPRGRVNLPLSCVHLVQQRIEPSSCGRRTKRLHRTRTAALLCSKSHGLGARFAPVNRRPLDDGMHEPPPDIRDRVAVLTEFAREAAERGEYMFYIRIPADIQPLERGELFEDPLHEALQESGLGEVTGGGSQLGENDTIAYCGIDVVVTEREAGLQIVRHTMRGLQAPSGTVIEEFVPRWQELPL